MFVFPGTALFLAVGFVSLIVALIRDGRVECATLAAGGLEPQIEDAKAA
jgi:hypothetical protein